MATLAAEACCRPGDFEAAGLHLSAMTPVEGLNPLRRRFPEREHSLSITTVGAGVVVATTPNWMSEASELFRDAEPQAAFDIALLSQVSYLAARHSRKLHGPFLYSVVSSHDLRERKTPAGYTIDVGGESLLPILNHMDWPNALSPNAIAQGRPVTVAALGLCNGDMVGLATATADSDTLWQIGIDVLSEHGGRGLGTALTYQAVTAVLDHGGVPYYGTTVDNIASQRLAQAVGFYPYWVSAYTIK